MYLINFIKCICIYIYIYIPEPKSPLFRLETALFLGGDLEKERSLGPYSAPLIPRFFETCLYSSTNFVFLHRIRLQLYVTYFFKHSK